MPKIYSFDYIRNIGKSIHGDKYEYLEFVIIKRKKHIRLKCNDCGYIFNQVIHSHINLKCGCANCENNKKYNLDEIKEKSIQINDDIFDYIEIIKIDKERYIKLKCKICDYEFKQTIDNHLNKKCGCPRCNKRVPHTLYEVKTLGNKIHDNKYEYLELSKREKHSIVKIKCKNCNTIFEQYVDNHLNKENGCLICKPISKGSDIIIEYLKEKNISYEREKKFSNCKYKRNLLFDFYIPEYNILIEYNGEQHYKPNNLFGGYEALKKQKIRDDIKIKYCTENNLKLIIIDYKSINNINNILDNKIKKGN